MFTEKCCPVLKTECCSVWYKCWFEDSGIERVWAESEEAAVAAAQFTESGRFMWVVYASPVGHFDARCEA